MSSLRATTCDALVLPTGIVSLLFQAELPFAHFETFVDDNYINDHIGNVDDGNLLNSGTHGGIVFV